MAAFLGQWWWWWHAFEVGIFLVAPLVALRDIRGVGGICLLAPLVLNHIGGAGCIGVTRSILAVRILVGRRVIRAIGHHSLG